MSTSSADPVKLHDFVRGVKVARRGAETEQSSVAALSRTTIAACEGYVSVPALGALATLFSNMGENETFVSTIRLELLAADHHGDGPITVSDSQLAGALKRSGVDTPPADVQFDPTTIVGIPQTSGMVDDPICAANGNMVHQDTDLDFPAIAGALTILRTYNSVQHRAIGAFGAGWSSVIDVVLTATGDRAAVRLPDGATVEFGRSVDGWSHDSRRVRGLDEHDGSGEQAAGFVLHLDHERRMRFDVDGVLTGWDAGVGDVQVERADGRIVLLREQHTGRRLEIVWNGALVSALVSSDGRRADFRRDGEGRIDVATTVAGDTHYRWDGGLLLAVTDADGVSPFVNVYDDGGRVIEQTSPFGRVTSYQYAFPGATVITDERDVRQAMVHDGRGNLTAVVDVDGSAMRLTYDHADRVVRVVAKSGAHWRYDYDDATGDLLRRHDPDGLSQSWTWDELGRCVTDTDRTGAVTRFEYDDAHRTPVRITAPDGTVTTHVLDTFGQPIRITDPDGVERRLAWDADGQLASMANSVGAVTTFVYDATGLMTRIIDPAGVETIVEYERDRVTRSTRSDAISSYSYTAAGRIDGGSEPGDLRWSATFGGHGGLATLTDALGSTVRFDYDHLGDITAVTAPDGAVFRHEYDAVGRLVAAIDPTGATVRKAYDVDGRLVELTDADGGTMRRTLDVLGRTVESVAADGAITRWTYHPNGEVATVTGPDGRAWSTEIDPVGRVVAVIEPSGSRATREYSPAGRLVARTSPAGRTERFEYDDAGRCVAMVGIDGLRRTMVLDERGQVTSMDIGNVDVSDEGHRQVGVTWDEQRRMVGYRTDAAAASFDWDSGGRLIGSVDPSGVAVSYDWDERGLLRSATDAAGATSVYRYDERGRLASQEMPGGRSTTWGYDTSGRLRSIVDPSGLVTEWVRNGSGVVTGMRREGEGWDRTLDSAGREVTRTTLDGSTLGTYDYDIAGRMVSASSPGNGLVTEFLWDDADRITQVTDATGTSTIERDADGWAVAFTNQNGIRTIVERDRSGRMVAVRDGEAGEFRLPDAARVRDPAGRLLIGPDATVYRYDDAGRLAEIVPPNDDVTQFSYGADGLIATENGPNGVRVFEYDAAGRVQSITIDGAGTTDIEYDAAGRRSVETSPDGSTTHYRWDVLDRLVGIDRIEPGGVTNSVTLELDALGRPQRINGESVGYDAAAGLPNLIGGVRLVEAGRASWRSDDRTWMVPRPDVPRGVSVGDLVLLGARAYDPSTRQFLSADPLMAVPATNGASSAYTYAWHDPVNFADPSGLRPISKEEYDAIREMEEKGRFGQAWDAIKEDPWGTVAMVGVAALGVGLMFVPGAQAIGAGILIGVATSAGTGLISGNFDPRQVAISGAIGGISGGVGAATSSVAVGVGSGAVIGGGGDVIAQVADGKPIDWGSVGVSTMVGGVTGGIGARLNSVTAAKPGAATATDVTPSVPQGPPLHSPNFIVNSNGEIVPVPTGAVGPTAVDSGNGFQFTGGSGGHGLDPRVSNVRVMDPVTTGKYPHPNGYVSYSNGASPPQTVNPYTGQTIAKSDPNWHIDWGPK